MALDGTPKLIYSSKPITQVKYFLMPLDGTPKLIYITWVARKAFCYCKIEWKLKP